MSKRKLYSSWLVVIYALFAVSLFVYNEFFQQSFHRDVGREQLTTPIQENVLNSLKTIDYKNSLGEYKLALEENNEWYLTSPRKMPASTKSIEGLTSKLKSISLFSIHNKDSLNLRNFSLDEPPIIVNLTTKLDEEITIKLGLHNPINNTTYISISNKELIYQVNLDHNYFQNLSMSNVINPYIFKEKLKDIDSIDIYRYKQKESSNRFTRNDNNWTSKRYKSFDIAKLEAKINKILLVKSHMIVDSRNPELETLINNYLDNTRYTIKLKANGQTTTYTVSPLTKEINELKLSSKKFFIMKSSNDKNPHIIDKKYLSEFMVYYSEIK